MVGKELHTSEVPKLCAVIQKGIWERVLVELGKAKTEVYSKDKSAKSITFFISGRLLPRTVVKSLGGRGWQTDRRTRPD